MEDSVPRNLPKLTPAAGLLPLTPTDASLSSGIEEVTIPPADLESKHLLLHAGLRQAVYYGTHLLDRIVRIPEKPRRHLPVVMLFRSILDLSDSIATLIRFGSSFAASILLRSLFEAYVQLQFILQGKSFHTDRADSCWAGYRIDQLETFTKYDPSTDPGKRFHDLLQKDETLKKADFAKRSFSEEREILIAELSTPPYDKCYEQYQRNKGKPKEWYSLCCQATNLRELARVVELESHYALLYSWLSSKAHATDVFSGFVQAPETGGVQVHQLRGPLNLLDAVPNMTANYLLTSFNLLLDVYFKADKEIMRQFVDWYKGYRPFYQWVYNGSKSKS